MTHGFCPPKLTAKKNTLCVFTFRSTTSCLSWKLSSKTYVLGADENIPGLKKDLSGPQQGVHLWTLECGAHVNPICYSQCCCNRNGKSKHGKENLIRQTHRPVTPIGQRACKRHAQRYGHKQKQPWSRHDSFLLFITWKGQLTCAFVKSLHYRGLLQTLSLTLHIGPNRDANK